MGKPKDPKDELKIEWSKKENDFMVYYPSGPDGHYIHGAFFGRRLGIGAGGEPTRPVVGHYTGLPNILIIEELGLKEELEARGYDLTTLKFSIKKKKRDTSNEKS